MNESHHHTITSFDFSIFNPLYRMGKRDTANGMIQYTPTLFPVPSVVGSSSSADAVKAPDKGSTSQQDPKKEEKVSAFIFYIYMH